MQAQSFPLATRVDVPAEHWDGQLAVDLFAPEGTPWLAVFDGIAEARDYPLGGHTVMLTAADGTQAYYAHGLLERVSGAVKAGQVLGYVGTSGNATGTPPHLHFAAGRINDQGGGTVSPREWLAGAVAVEPVGRGDGEARGAGSVVPVLVLGGIALIVLGLID